MVLPTFLDILTTVLRQGNEEIMIHTPHQTLIILVINSRRINGWGCVMHTGETKGAFRIFIGKREEKKQL